MYNEWFCKVEIGIHHVQPPPHLGFWVVGGDDFGSSTLRFATRWSMIGLIQEFHSISTLPMSHHMYNEWLEKVNIGMRALKWSPQRVFQSCVGGVKVGLALVHFSHQDWVSLDWFGQFTASQPFHSLTICIMNGFARLRLEFIMCNHHHILAFESWVVTISAPVPYVSQQDGVWLVWFKNFTASQPFQCPIICIMNGWRRLTLVCVL